MVIVDTAVPKKGKHSVGLAWQYVSALGKNANCQTLVSLILARDEVPVMVALRLFLPESWTSDLARLKRAGVPVGDDATRRVPYSVIRTETPLHKFADGAVTLLLRRLPIPRLDQSTRVVVQPIGRAQDAPHHDLLLNPHDFDGLVGQNDQRMVQTRRIHPNLVVADRFEHQGDFLGSRKHEVY
jgi:hypothetical protein